MALAVVGGEVESIGLDFVSGLDLAFFTGFGLSFLALPFIPHRLSLLLSSLNRRLYPVGPLSDIYIKQ